MAGLCPVVVSWRHFYFLSLWFCSVQKNKMTFETWWMSCKLCITASLLPSLLLWTLHTLLSCVNWNKDALLESTHSGAPLEYFVEHCIKERWRVAGSSHPSVSKEICFSPLISRVRTSWKGGTEVRSILRWWMELKKYSLLSDYWHECTQHVKSMTKGF